MRKACLDCCIKHLSQALILQSEAAMGYPEHKYLALGHMAEAADEIVAHNYPLANDIREARKAYELIGESAPTLVVWKAAIASKAPAKEYKIVDGWLRYSVREEMEWRAKCDTEVKFNRMTTKRWVDRVRQEERLSRTKVVIR